MSCTEGSHHFIVDEDNNGVCKKCGATKTFDLNPVPSKVSRRYWEISYELLRDFEYAKDSENDNFYDDWND